MFRSSISLIAVCAIGSALVAQPNTTPKNWANKFFLSDIDVHPTQTPPAVITHDFGSVPQGTVCSHKFTIKNIYDVPMQVTEVRRSCGCLTALPPERVLQPHESAEFQVVMDTSKFSGPNSPTIYVTFGPHYVSEAVLRVSANSRTDVVLKQGGIRFGTVAQGTDSTAVSELAYQGRQRDWKIVGVIPPSGPFTVQVRDAGKEGKLFYIEASLKPDAPAGLISEVVTLRTNDPNTPLIRVNVEGRVQAPLTVSATRVQFSGVKVGESASQLVHIRGTEPFRIVQGENVGEGVTVDTFPFAGPTQVVTFKFSPSAAGKVRREITLKTDLKSGASVKVWVEATADAAPPETR